MRKNFKDNRLSKTQPTPPAAAPRLRAHAARQEFNTLQALEPRQLLAVTWGAADQLIDLDAAASAYPAYDGRGQAIAIIDTGIDYTHPAVAGKYLGGYDFLAGDTDPRDTDGHGTGLASIAVGNTYTYNGAQYRGVAPGARIIALRVDNGRSVPDSRYEAAFQWIIDNRTKYNITVVNCSFGAGHYTTEAQRTIYADEMQELADAGVFIVASSGNDGAQSPYGVEYPGADPSVYAAGSVNANDVISKYTERGPIMDILAPGEGVPIAYLDADDNHIYLPSTGTSFSAPFVAGAAAVLKQIDSSFTPGDVMSILRASGADNFDGDAEATPNTQLSWPRLDVDNAIALALTRRAGAGTVANTGRAGRENAMKFDRDGVLYYAWYDATDRHLKFATQNANLNWSAVSTVDAGADVGHYVSLALTSTGKPALAYYDSYNADLKYAEWDGRRWNVTTVDARRTTGMYPSLAFDAYDDPIITYYSRTDGDLRLAFDDGSGWALSVIDPTQDSGRYSAFAISRSGQWSVAYENTTTGQFKFARRGTSAWSFQTVDAATRIGGGYISLAYDSANHPAISYYDAWNADLKYAVSDGSNWSAGTVASQFSQGLYTNLAFDASDTADIVYYNKTYDAVFRATGGPGNWNVGQLLAGGGRHVFVARFAAAARVFSYYDAADDALRVDTF